MTEFELIKKIRELKQIQPRKDWVVLTKKQILGEEEAQPGWRFVFSFSFRKLAWQSALGLVVLVFLSSGVLATSKNSLPGDFLYPVKKTVENVKTKFTAEEEKSIRQLELVNNRLEDLAKTAQTRQGKDLPLAYKEVQETVSQAARTLLVETNPNISKKVVAQAQKIEEQKQAVEQLLMTQIETEELDNAVAPYYKTEAGREIDYWKTRTLTDDQKSVLEEAERLYEEGNYSQALELILNNQ